MKAILPSVTFAVLLIAGSLAPQVTFAGGKDLYDKGSQADENGDYNTAVSYYDRAISSGDLSRVDLANVYYDRGLSLGRLKKREAAIDSYRDAITLDPRHYQALGSLCFQMTQLDQLDQALHNCNKALDIEPTYAAGINIRAQIWQKKGQHDRAETDYRRAIQLDPKNWVLYYNLGNFYDILKRAEDARRSYRDAFDRAPAWGRTHPSSSKIFKKYGLMN